MTMPLRFLLSSHGASLFGAERILLGIARGLLERGHAVTMELPHAGPAVEAARAIAGLNVVVSGRARLPRNARELAGYAVDFGDSVRRVRACLLADEFDVLWVNSLYNPAAVLAGRAARLPIVWHLHEANFAGPAGRLAARWIGTHCDVAVAPSRFVAGSYHAAGLLRARLRIVPNALLQEIQPAPLRPRTGRFMVGYVGQFEPRKRVADVLGAVARVDGTEALLAGAGKARRAVEADILRLKLADRTHLTGFQHDVASFLARCDCIVIPSRDEAFSLSALEAMAAGRPVIAAQSGALPEVLGDAALFYPLGDVDRLAACLRTLRDQASLAESLRTQGLARAHEFSLERLIDGVEAVTHDVTRGAATPDSAEVPA